jgi:hypothetical protein
MPLNLKFWSWPRQLREQAATIARLQRDLAIAQLTAHTAGHELELVQARLAAHELFPAAPLGAPAWTEGDEAQADKFFRSDTGAKLLATLVAQEQDINRRATVQAPYELSAGKARGFRHAIATLRTLSGSSLPSNETPDSTSPPAPEDVAETFKA